ncbi:MAG: hypothetical protein V4622_09515 [Bacteroidota bacterium]
MKKVAKLLSLVLFVGFLLNLQACVVVHKKDNGKHKGWYKNKRNPHNPNTVKVKKVVVVKEKKGNNGNGNGKGKKK